MEDKFGQLAFAMIDSDMPVDVTEKFALKYVKHESLLKIGASANLLELRSDQIRFYHQLIQEYFAASKIVDTRINTFLTKPYFSKYTGHRVNSKWEQVLIAKCGTIQNTELFLELITPINPFLVVDCLDSGVSVSVPLLNVVQNKIRTYLDAKQSSARIAAIKALRSLADSNSLIKLFTMLGDQSERVRINALEAMDSISHGSTEAIYNLLGEEYKNWVLKSLDDRNSKIRAYAVRAMGQMGNATHFSKIAGLLSDGDREIHISAIKALGNLGNPIILPDLIAKLHHKDGGIRRAAINAIMKLDNATSLPILLEMLTAIRNESYRIEQYSDQSLLIKLLGMSRYRPAIYILTSMLNNPLSASLSCLAAEALGEIGDPAVIQDLMIHLSDDRVPHRKRDRIDRIEPVHNFAARALERIGTPEALEAVERWRRGQNN
jgi:HEAT repeat protein